jgi:hypothetical protein
MRRRGMEERPASDSHQVVVPLNVARDAPAITAACGWLWIQDPKNGMWLRSFVKANATQLCISSGEKVCRPVMT